MINYQTEFPVKLTIDCQPGRDSEIPRPGAILHVAPDKIGLVAAIDDVRWLGAAIRVTVTLWPLPDVMRRAARYLGGEIGEGS